MGRGFTIIELLIVMALIALLASLVLATIGSTRERSRDARREADIKEIQNALDLYSVTNRAFPICASEVVINGESDCLSVQLIAVGAAGQVATDPSGKASGVCGNPANYVYCYVSDGRTYELRYNLETSSIPGKLTGWQPPVKP
ncbi:MAG: prepilin-type N-terminal cleavage/methylation domain-containing protein [Patescibacteria group bacterium]|jgi:general secretion pathway protein G